MFALVVPLGLVEELGELDAVNQALRRNFDGTSKVFFRFFDRRRFDGAVNLTNEVSRESTDVRHGVLETRQDVIGIVVVWFNLQRLDEVAFDGVRELDFLSRLGEHAQTCVRNRERGVRLGVVRREFYGLRR